METSVTIEAFPALTIGMIVYFAGARLTRKIAFLREFNIPEPVSGGLFAAIIAFGVYVFFDIAVTYDLSTRDKLLVFFFTAIGLDARISDLVRGGKPLVLLLILTIGYMFMQNLVALGGTAIFGLPPSVAVLTGSAALIGGHGTAIAWAPEISETFGVSNALEIGVASATLGLILASLIGGPIARHLIQSRGLKAPSDTDALVGLPYKEDNGDKPEISHVTFMSALLALNVAVLIGYTIHLALGEYGIKLPLFVPCLMAAIVLSNTVPRMFPKLAWPARTPSLALIADLCLSIFLAMSLMSMQLWTLADLAGPLLIILFLQTLMVVVFILFILFRVMGSDYESAVLSAGFAGFALGATPTAMANMTAVAKKHGPAPNAFIILPLIAAFFVDIANAIIIPLFLN